MRIWSGVFPSVLLLCCPLALGAQGLSRPPPVQGIGAISNCSNAINQIEMTACAEQSYNQADQDLNYAYGRAMSAADEMPSSNGVSPANMLRDAQRAWIPFRDKACAAEAQMANGGSIMGQITLECLTRLTRGRTEDLRIFAMRY